MPFDFLLDLFFPKRSLRGFEGMWVTPEELETFKLFPLMLRRPALGERGIAHLDHLVAAGKYDASPLLQKAIRTFKYGQISEIGTVLAGLMAKPLPALLPLSNPQTGDRAPVLCPVPLHWARRFQRGFNQSEVLAKLIANHQRWPVGQLLKRVRATGHQSHKGRAERLQSLTGAFRYCGPPEPPARVLLVDDVLTTGATLEACAGTLKAAGVKRVEAIVIAYA